MENLQFHKEQADLDYKAAEKKKVSDKLDKKTRQ